ncbi:A-kinase anchor protein 10, mitochondrial-like [Clytia hemisphaerica]|uniref:RGS domain-containing protein n=1 Tax=Clytia hemisphaerica TaxID=252671 RepID=A0A7M5UT68_9CNID
MSSKDKDQQKRGRKWRFSRKKMKEPTQVDTITLPFDLKVLLDKENINLKPRTSQCKVSKLCPTLMDILKKSMALGYFLEYLAEIKRKFLLDFWLEAETLRMVSETNYCRRTPTSARRRTLSRTRSLNSPSSKVENTIKTDSTKLNDISQENMDDKRVLNSNFNQSLNNLDHTVEQRESRNTFEQPLPRQSSTTLRSYEDFKSRAKSRNAIVDAVEIYTKYISLDAEHPINLSSEDRHLIEASICKGDNQLDPSCFAQAQDFAFGKLESFYEDFLSTTYMIAYQLHVLEEKELKFQDVLYDEPILFYFLEFLDGYKAKSVYEFYIIGENFEEDIERKLKDDCYELEEAVNDAMHIYERYFSMKCEQQLIADDKLRIVLENNICRDDGPQSNCFCIPMAYAWTALSEVYLPMFVKSNMYESYQNHLKKTLRYTEDVKSCSSRSSLSLEENFPLVENRPSPNNTIERSESKLNLFEETNLEDFWFKPLNRHSELGASRLTLGHVNEFGVFCSGMEEQPLDDKDNDASGMKKLGKKMKDLLRGETMEETEELAWKRARKIIDDIQKQTQG